MSGLTCYSHPNVERVQLVIKDKQGRIIPVGHNDFPFQYLRAASPQVEETLRMSGKKSHMVNVVQLPGQDARAYYNIFNAVDDSFSSGKIKTCVTIDDSKQPLTGYYRMYVAAADLGMRVYEDSLICRTMAMLFVDLSHKQLSISVFDVKSCLAYLQVDDEFYSSLAGAIGRAKVVNRLPNPSTFATFVENDAVFKKAVDKAEEEWKEIREGDEVISRRIW